MRMMKKTLAVCLVLALCVALLSACGEKIQITTDTGTYEVTDVEALASYGDMAPLEGGQLLVISVETLSADMDDMQTAFYDVPGATSNVTATVGGQTVPIRSISYTAHSNAANPDVRGALIFEVAPGLKKGDAVTLNGDRFDSVALTVTGVATA